MMTKLSEEWAKVMNRMGWNCAVDFDFDGDEDWDDDARDEVDDVEFRMMGVSCSNGDRDPDGETLLQIAASPSSSSSSSPSSSFSASLQPPPCIN